MMTWTRNSSTDFRISKIFKIFVAAYHMREAMMEWKDVKMALHAIILATGIFAPPE